jgi:hypothetical protein
VLVMGVVAAASLVLVSPVLPLFVASPPVGANQREDKVLRFSHCGISENSGASIYIVERYLPSFA